MAEGPPGLSLGPAAGHDSHPEGRPVSIEENKAVVRRCFQAFNDRDWAAEEAARSADFAAHVPGAPASLDGEGWKSFITAFLAGFPDFRLVLEDVLAEGGRVAGWRRRASPRRCATSRHTSTPRRPLDEVRRTADGVRQQALQRSVNR